MRTNIDGALEILEGCGPEFGSAALSNHGPMAAEALCALGRDDAVEDWAVRYRKRLAERPPNVGRISANDWQEALGEPGRVSDWEDFFAAELDQSAWPDVLERWLPRLLPGIMSSATHGLIRTAHAVRSLGTEQTRGRMRELASGLGYWAARYQSMPGTLAPVGPRMPWEVMDRLPIVPTGLRDPRPTSIFAAVRELDDFPPFADVVNLAAPGDDVSAFLSDLTTVMAVRYLENAGPASIPYVHTVTAPSALRMIVPHVSDAVGRLGARYAWQAAAAIHCRGHYPKPVTVPDVLPGAVDLVERAVFSGDEHAIKFTEACLRENALSPHPAFLAGPLDMSSRYGRNGREQG